MVRWLKCGGLLKKHWSFALPSQLGNGLVMSDPIEPNAKCVRGLEFPQHSMHGHPDGLEDIEGSCAVTGPQPLAHHQPRLKPLREVAD